MLFVIRSQRNLYTSPELRWQLAVWEQKMKTISDLADALCLVVHSILHFLFIFFLCAKISFRTVGGWFLCSTLPPLTRCQVLVLQPVRKPPALRSASKWLTSAALVVWILIFTNHFLYEVEVPVSQDIERLRKTYLNHSSSCKWRLYNHFTSKWQRLWRWFPDLPERDNIFQCKLSSRALTSQFHLVSNLELCHFFLTTCIWSCPWNPQQAKTTIDHRCGWILHLL